MLAKALNILASTANRFHLLLAASQLTSDMGKRKALEERGTGVVVVPIFFPLRQTKHAYNYVKHTFFFLV